MTDLIMKQIYKFVTFLLAILIFSVKRIIMILEVEKKYL